MTAETPDLMHSLQSDRRPAIWPWLVMPLIALTAFYCLERLSKEAARGSPAAIHAEAGGQAGTSDGDVSADIR